jgi:hypothetical protein
MSSLEKVELCKGKLQLLLKEVSDELSLQEIG